MVLETKRNTYDTSLMARFTPQILDEIRNRLTLSDIVGRRVTYDKRKSQPQKGDFWACCPFHNEKTPSFHVDDRRNIYHCFGCGVTGDHFRFLTEKEGLSFPEAVERLADEAGVQLPKLDPREVEREKKRGSLYDVVAFAQQFFLEQLQGPLGASARGYLQKRGLSLETQRHFGIGYAPRDRSALKQYLVSKGVEHDQMVEAGLVVAGPDVPVSYDKFRDRIMFPILDLRERVIAFGGRAMSADNPAKYMNSPETPLFSKRTVLYNAANARKVAYDRKRIVVVEGYMDVIALAQAGIAEALAPLGTALTGEQLHLLWKIADEPILCFDGDEAGQRAASRSVDVALPLLKPGKTVQFTMLPDGQDPDDLINAEGIEAVEDLLNDARSLSDLIWVREAESGSFETPERKAALEARFSDLIRSIADQNVRRHYEQAFRDKMQAFFSPNGFSGQSSGGYRQNNYGRSYNNGGGAYNRDYNSRRGGFGGGRAGRNNGPMITDRLRKNPLTSKNYGRGQPLIPREVVLVATLMNHPELLGNYFESFSELSFKNSVLAKLQSGLLDSAAVGQEFSASELRIFLVRKGLEDEVFRIEAAVNGLHMWQIGANAPVSSAEMGYKQAQALHHRAHTLHKELKAAERAYANDESELNLERLLDVNAQIVSVDEDDVLLGNLEDMPNG